MPARLYTTEDHKTLRYRSAVHIGSRVKVELHSGKKVVGYLCKNPTTGEDAIAFSAASEYVRFVRILKIL